MSDTNKTDTEPTEFCVAAKTCPRAVCLYYALRERQSKQPNPGDPILISRAQCGALVNVTDPSCISRYLAYLVSANWIERKAKVTSSEAGAKRLLEIRPIRTRRAAK